MISYQFGPHSKYELTFAFDPAGAVSLQACIAAASKQDIREIDAVRIDRGKDTPAVIAVAFSSDSDRLGVAGHCLTLELTEESLEYCDFKLRKFHAEGDFSPPEFISLERPGWKAGTYVYFVKAA
jgi:hypothetical protein